MGSDTGNERGYETDCLKLSFVRLSDFFFKTSFYFYIIYVYYYIYFQPSYKNKERQSDKYKIIEINLLIKDGQSDSSLYYCMILLKKGTLRYE